MKGPQIENKVEEEKFIEDWAFALAAIAREIHKKEETQTRKILNLIPKPIND